jgi:AraC-like DNA-binding protein
MHYAEWSPPPPLARDVECLWRLAGSGIPVPATVFPDGCIELLVHLGERFSWREGVQPEAFVVGQLSSPLCVMPSAAFETWAARFRPAGARTVLGDGLAALADRVVPLEDVVGREAARALIDALRSVREESERRDAFVTWLVRRGRRPVADATRAAVSMLAEHRGVVRVDALARAHGWSERQLERRFAAEVGCSPKQLARTMRFQSLVQRLDDGRNDWAGLAWECGFFDQAHLIRDVRAFTGATPTQLRDDAFAFARQFLAPDRLESYFA